MRFLRLWCFLLAFLCVVTGVRAQTVTGSIVGRIVDPSGAALVGVRVEVTNRGTQLRRTAVSSENGTYTVIQLPPGVYDVAVTENGFAKETHRDIQLLVNQNLTVDFSLSLATTSEKIEVTGAPPALEVQSATLGQVIQHDQIVDLPLNGRSFTQLVLLTPGAAPAQSGQQGSFTIREGAGGISPSVNGQRGQQNNFTMDGVLNNATYTDTWAISPPPDALQEFNVQSHITDAQFSISSGANINLVTRSGTNSFHGAAYEFIRNNVLDATTYPATSTTPYKQNQYGVYFGGPIFKNHAFVSAYWEGFRSEQSQSYLSATLTDAMKSGDFSSVLGTTPIGTDSLGRPEFANEIYDPYSSRPDPNNPGKVIRNPYPNNTIPKAQINGA